MSDKTVSGAELVVETLKAHDVPHIFGIPGAKVDAVFDAVCDNGPEIIICHHEQNAAFMAAATGRLTGKAGICLATSGPGASNLVTGVATANSEGDPVVALAGAVPLSMYSHNTHQSMDTRSLFNPITKFSAEVMDSGSVPDVVHKAFRIAEQPTQGASFVSLPQDILTNRIPYQPVQQPNPILFGGAHPQAVRQAADHINAAKNPVLLLGMDASQPFVADTIRQLLKQTPIAVVNTFAAAGVISHDLYNCFLGRVGLFKNQPGDIALNNADLIITIGYSPIEYDPILWNKDANTPIIHIGYQQADLEISYNPVCEVVGDLAVSVASIASELDKRESLESNQQIQLLRHDLQHIMQMGSNKTSSIGVHPLRFVHDLRRFVSDDTTVCCDVGSIYIWMARYFHSFEPRRLLFSNGQQTLGVALPWAIAASLLHPNEKVISMSGDGGFLFSSMELATAVRHKCNIVHFVWTDHSYDMVKIQQLKKYGRESAVSFMGPDIVKYAESFGAHGLAINTADDIEPVMRKAMSLSGPVLVNVNVDYSDNSRLLDQLHPCQQD
ncbi:MULTISPECIES: acetolactate synthase AlsS [unclassified Photobacterium]|uniref:acetolactate synthase AlsS n=1 Tax=unclassified Photobacterium TaxID=2628852 RepID=UPI001EDFAADF|nr:MULTISPECIES: acetolactate synthase AlsS [unclassified Photobacterium]MCG3864521.1 acetolactate synthase AlsS [Photobacterium sp. Ph6]MCG3876586.1 acetolactate synthase AlsS [Photobacterium sp. Ph5]